MPTIALSNSIAFQQMTDPGKQFPWIRVFGTVGWIVAGLINRQLSIEKSRSTFHMAAIASLPWASSVLFFPTRHPKAKPTLLSQRRSVLMHLCFSKTELISFLHCRDSRLYSAFVLLWICQPISDRRRHGKRRR